MTDLSKEIKLTNDELRDAAANLTRSGQFDTAADILVNQLNYHEQRPSIVALRKFNTTNDPNGTYKLEIANKIF